MTDCGEGEFKVSTKEADKELEQLRQTAAMTAKQTASVVRDGYNAISLMADIMGVAIPFWIDLMANAVILTAQTLADIATMEAASLNPLLMAKAVLSFMIAGMMFYRALELQRSTSVIESKLNSMIGLINIAKGYGW